MRGTSSSMPPSASGTLSYLDAGGTQDIYEITANGNKNILAAYFDCNALTQNGTFSVQIKVDGTNYRTMTNLSQAFTVASDDSVCIPGPIPSDQDIKFCYTEGADEGAARDIHYLIIWEQ